MSIRRDPLARPLPRTVRPGVRYSILLIGTILTVAGGLLLRYPPLWLFGEAIWLAALALYAQAWRVGRMRRKRGQAINRIRARELELGLRERDSQDAASDELGRQLARNMVALAQAMNRAHLFVGDLTRQARAVEIRGEHGIELVVYVSAEESEAAGSRGE